MNEANILKATKIYGEKFINRNEEGKKKQQQTKQEKKTLRNSNIRIVRSVRTKYTKLYTQKSKSIEKMCMFRLTIRTSIVLCFFLFYVRRFI